MGTLSGKILREMTVAVGWRPYFRLCLFSSTTTISLPLPQTVLIRRAEQAAKKHKASRHSISSFFRLAMVEESSHHNDDVSFAEELSLSSGSRGHTDSGSAADRSTSNASSRSAQEMLEQKERMFQTESQQVKRLKYLVLLIMVLVAIAVSTTVFFVSSKAETAQFEALYEGAAEKLLGK